MQIAIDPYIPFVRGLFEKYGAKVVYGDNINGCDAVIIRTRTRCDSAFLKNHSPKIIATATIGYDHIDVEYCHRHGIELVTAAGCNARAVAQWVFAALIALNVDNPPEHTLGIVGVGNVGSVVDRIARSVGFRTLLCDPPRAAHENGFVTLDFLLENSTIVTLHTPLNTTTRGMADESFFKKISREAIFLNSSRGEVVNERALLDSGLKKIALDVWCNEPKIDRELLERVNIATPHIAGYSQQGKAMGSAIVVRAVAASLGIDELLNWYPPEVEPTMINESLTWQQMRQTMCANYSILADDCALRKAPLQFENLRSNYHYRKEFF